MRPAFRQTAQNDKRRKFRDDALTLSEQLREAGIDLSVDDNATVRAKMGVTLEQGANDESGAVDGDRNEGVKHENAEQQLNSRLAQWFASLRVGGSGPRTVEARAEDIGPINRGTDNGAAEQGDASREEIREQSQRLIERAKAEGFFWGADHPILSTLRRLPSAGGAEHQVFAVGSGADRFIIRATDNGYFGPRADISPAQYLARLDDYSRTFPGLQTRLIGVSESPDVEGHAVIYRGSRDGTTDADSFGQLGASTGLAPASLGVWLSADSADAAKFGVSENCGCCTGQSDLGRRGSIAEGRQTI